MDAVAFVGIVLLAAWSSQAAAYPSLWASEGWVKCPDHPNKGDGGHGAPRPDPTIKFALTDKAGKAAAALCPGATYTVKVSFPQPRYALLTADAGKFAKADAKCPSRQVMDRTKAYTNQATQDASFAVPCGSASKAIQLRVTSATGSTGAFQQALASFPVNPKCAAC